MFNGKRVMITGGTGSFGNAVLHRLLDTNIAEVIIFSRDEKKQEDMRIALRNNRVKFVIGDVRDRISLEKAIRGVDFLFHAAALKQVPSCEFYPIEAVRTNIVGTENVLDAAVNAGVKRVVLLSTDKAVYPINAMGISKAMAEKLLVARARALTDRSSTVLCATRYGNVMASRGSVIPLFIERIQANQPLPITDPTMTRFLMSLDESVALVLHAFTYGHQGDIFVQKAPATSIGELGSALKTLFRSTVPIEVIGTRHGEKRFETLVSREEMVKAEDQGKYFRIPADNRNLNYELFISEGNPQANSVEDYTSDNTTSLKGQTLLEFLRNNEFIRNQLADRRGETYFRV